MKMKKLILILITLCLFTGCNSNKEVSAKKVADTVLTLYSDTNYNKKGLSKDEIKLIDDLIESELPENKIIKLDDYIKDENIEENVENSSGVYEDNGHFYIAYSDLNFEEEYIGEDTENTYSIASVYVKKRQIPLYKNEIYLIGTNTSDDAKFTYKYLGKEENDDNLSFYYQSYLDDSGLIIKLNIDSNEKFTNIELTYLPMYKEPNSND